MQSFWNERSGDVVPKLQQLGTILGREMNKLSNTKKREISILSRRLEVLSALDPDDENLAKMEEIRIALNWEADKEELEWEEKARANWLKFGDRNTTFFHNFANSRKWRNKVKKLRSTELGLKMNKTNYRSQLIILNSFFKHHLHRMRKELFLVSTLA